MSQNTSSPAPLTITPIIYGNTSYRHPSTPESCLWTLYIRHAQHPTTPIPHVSHVKFQLHPTFGEKEFITLMSPPWEITLDGWGEFEAQIHLYTANSKLPMVSLPYLVRLFPDDGCSQLVSEVYDELVVREDSEIGMALERCNEIGCGKEVSVESVRTELLPNMVRRELRSVEKRGIKVVNVEDLALESDLERLKVLERLRLEMIRKSRDNVEKAIRLAERKVKEFEDSLARDERCGYATIRPFERGVDKTMPL